MKSQWLKLPYFMAKDEEQGIRGTSHSEPCRNVGSKFQAFSNHKTYKYIHILVTSPSQTQLILTGMSMGGKDEGGAVVFIDKRKHNLVRKVSRGVES